jgi:hypothetical protein
VQKLKQLKDFKIVFIHFIPDIRDIKAKSLSQRADYFVAKDGAKMNGNKIQERGFLECDDYI